MRRPVLVVHLLLLWCGTTSVGAEEHTESLTREQTEAFAYFDGLGYPDVSGKRFVCLPKMWHESLGLGVFGDDSPCEHGFVLEEGEERVVVLSVGLKRYWIRRDRRDLVETVDLATFLEAGLDLLDGPTARNVDPFGVRRWVTPLRYRLFVLARWAALHGRNDLARRAFAKCAGIRFRGESEDAASFRESLESEFSREMLTAAVEMLAERGWTWRDVHAAHARWLEHFGERDEEGLVGRRTETLAAQAGEEAAREERGPMDPATLSVEERVRGLLHGLGERGGMGHFGGRDRTSAFARLLEVGPEAVPHLLEALTDRRLVRQLNQPVFGHMQYRTRMEVVERGQLAWIVLSRITGIELESRRHMSFPVLKSGDLPKVREQVTEWWGAVQAQGVREYLLAKLAEERCPLAARTLVWRHPDVALARIRAAVADDDGTSDAASALVAALVGLDTDEAERFLREELETHPLVRRRVAAARTLLVRGADGIVEELTRQWRAGHDVTGNAALPFFLARRGRLDALEALAADLARQPGDVRLAVAHALALSPFFDAPALASDLRVGKPPADVRELRERLLVAALDPSEERGPLPPYWGPAPGEATAIAHAAAEGLLWLDRSRYEYSRLDRDDEERAAERRALVDAWRIANGLPPLPGPGERQGPVVPLEVEREVLAALRGAADTEAAVEALAPLASLGAQVVPVLLDWADTLEASHPARQVVRDRAHGLARRVRLGAPEGEAQAVEAAWPGLAALDGELLDASALPDLIAACFASTESRVGLLLTLARPEDGSGVTLSVEALQGAAPGEGGWELRLGLVAGKERRLHFDAMRGAHSVLDAPAWRRFVRELHRVLTADTPRDFTARILLVPRG